MTVRTLGEGEGEMGEGGEGKREKGRWESRDKKGEGSNTFAFGNMGSVAGFSKDVRLRIEYEEVMESQCLFAVALTFLLPEVTRIYLSIKKKTKR